MCSIFFFIQFLLKNYSKSLKYSSDLIQTQILVWKFRIKNSKKIFLVDFYTKFLTVYSYFVICLSNYSLFQFLNCIFYLYILSMIIILSSSHFELFSKHLHNIKLSICVPVSTFHIYFFVYPFLKLAVITTSKEKIRK